ncbi:hypothetical protein BU23DRAFT_453815 [Bimuria novae-zelandiae CBS 107.79]|uniref:Uncharacterized protein n=1 Tax=Bimuria novae-zelandiae CBS 107.79 TaxID=1447943 RepID=A0A6A5VQ58_9PLEO|nr:hypothetical protein BU23DRAFT_453815 [Bimuria novae-zelandiae CBS 107.79]
MQSPTPAREETPFATPPLPSPGERTSPSEESDGGSNTNVSADALVPRTAQKIADLLSGLKRELETLHGTSVEIHGQLQLTVPGGSQYALKPVSRADGLSIRVKASQGASKGKAPTVQVYGAGASSTSHYKRTRRDSDAELEKELVSRKSQRLDNADNGAHLGAVDDDDDILPLITKEDLESIVAKLQHDIQEDTSECVNHVQRLLRRFKGEWHEESTWDFEQASNSRSRRARPSVAENGTAPAAAFPSPGLDRDDQDITVPNLIKQESQLISSQIRWLEECRRIASDAHDKREENWRTSSANFHDKARQERETFQGRMLQEQGIQTQTLNRILNEVKTFSLYMHSMKWETPGSMSVGPATPAYHPPAIPSYHPPAFPTQPPPAFPTQSPPAPSRGRRRPRGSARGK